MTSGHRWEPDPFLSQRQGSISSIHGLSYARDSKAVCIREKVPDDWRFGSIAALVGSRLLQLLHVDLLSTAGQDPQFFRLEGLDYFKGT